MTVNLILSIVTLIFCTIALYVYALAYKKFLKGEFSSFVKWMMGGMSFFLIHLFLHLLEDFEIFRHEIIETLVYVFMLITVLFFIKATLVLINLARSIGFVVKEKKLKRIKGRG